MPEILPEGTDLDKAEEDWNRLMARKGCILALLIPSFTIILIVKLFEWWGT